MQTMIGRIIMRQNHVHNVYRWYTQKKDNAYNSMSSVSSNAMKDENLD